MLGQPAVLFSSVQSFVIAGVAIAGIVQLGFIVLFSDSKNTSNKLFFAASLCGAIWGTLNFLVFEVSVAAHALWLLRISVVFAVLYSLCLFLFYVNYPASTLVVSRALRYAAVTVAVGVSCLLLTPFMFGHPVTMHDGSIVSVTNGPAILLLVISIFFYVIGGLLLLTKKMLAESNIIVKRQTQFILGGSFITYILILTFNLVLPALFEDATYVPLAGIWMLPLLGITTYAVAKHSLFNVKVFTAQLVVFVLTIVVLFQVFYSDEGEEFIFRAVFFFLVLIVGVLLVRSVLKEVEQRELIEAQRKELEIANKQQQSLLHFISHEVKSYLTSGQGAFSAIVEGDYGEAPPKLKGVAEGALGKMREGVQMVMEILDASNLRLGTVTYKKEPFDFRAAVEDVVARLRPKASERHLTLDISVDTIKDYVVTGDGEKISQHVIRNLVDNAIRYTPKGSVHVTLARTDGHIRFSVKDSGVGITEEDKANLFTEGGRGKESIKVNVDSTGYGLFVAKQVVTAHGGTIRAESAGAGKGSEFIVELPAKEV